RKGPRAPAQVGPPIEYAEAGAGRIDEGAIVPVQLGRQVQRVGLDNGDVGCAETRDVLAELARSSGVDLDRGHVARELRRLAAGCSAQIEDALTFSCADRETRKLRAAALRPDPPFRERLPVYPFDSIGAGDVRRVAGGFST